MAELKGVAAFIVVIIAALLMVMVIPFVVWLLGYWTLPFGAWTFQNVWEIMWVCFLVYIVIFGLIGIWLFVRSLF